MLQGRGRWFPGKIDRVNSDGTYDVRCDDGDREFGAPRSRVKRKDSGGDDDRDGDRLEEGMEVTANFKGRGRWFSGKITRVNDDGTFDIRFDGAVDVSKLCFVFFAHDFVFAFI